LCSGIIRHDGHKGSDAVQRRLRASQDPHSAQQTIFSSRKTWPAAPSSAPATRSLDIPSGKTASASYPLAGRPGAGPLPAPLCWRAAARRGAP
jgi:hypothetical protein